MGGSASQCTFDISWDDLHRDACLLAERLGREAPFQAIVAITRGGLVPAMIVAKELNIRRIETISIASYNGDNSQGDLKLIKPVCDEILEQAREGAGVLIIDDLVDTGETLKMVRAMMPKAYYATLYAKPDGLEMVDASIREIDQKTWVVFPWDRAP